MTPPKLGFSQQPDAPEQPCDGLPTESSSRVRGRGVSLTDDEPRAAKSRRACSAVDFGSCVDREQSADVADSSRTLTIRTKSQTSVAALLLTHRSLHQMNSTMLPPKVFPRPFPPWSTICN